MNIDTIAGLLLLLLAAAVWWQVRGLEIGQMTYFGPGFLPRVLDVLLAAAAVVLVARGLLGSTAEPLLLHVRGPGLVFLGILVFAATIPGLGVGPVTVPALGLLIAGPLAVLISGFGSTDADWRELVVLGPGLTALATFLFSDLLGLTIPVFPDAITFPHDWGPDWPVRLGCLAEGAVALLLWLALFRGRRA